MRKMCVVSIAVVLCAALSWAQQPMLIEDCGPCGGDVRAFVMNGDRAYLASPREIYARDAQGTNWRSVFALSGGGNEILSLAGMENVLLAGTRRGLYRSTDHGESWRTVFRSPDGIRSEVLWIDVPSPDGSCYVIGTGGGVFVSDDAGATWRDISANLRDQRVMCLTCLDERVYAYAERGLYGTVQPGSGWERLYAHEVSHEELSGDDGEGSGDPIDPDCAGSWPGGGCVTRRGGRLILGAGSRVLYSDDGGRSWRSFPAEGISGLVRCVRPSGMSERVYCATTRGVFLFEGDPGGPDAASWREIYRGSGRVLQVTDLVFDSQDEQVVWAATDHGLYRIEWLPETSSGEVVRQERRFRMRTAEPSFRELQRAAVRFADVSPVKTRNWQCQSRLKALLPKVSFGMDSGRSTTYEIYTSSSKDYYVLGPDDITEGWDISVSWELSDLIWSSAQTSIDVRARLTTQLRNDILDDLRRAYYERKRLLYELAARPPDDEALSYEKELRIEELTQAIDDLTGNYLSDRLGSKK